ncbi:MAG: hypothetical protein ACREDR_06180, partial [Blastocatellia bacterium]
RKSALRGVWAPILVALVCVWLRHPPAGFWSDDFVSHLFDWFFQTLGLYAAGAIVLGIIYVVANRVERGDPVKEDLSLIASILGLVVSILGLIPSLRDSVLEAIRQTFR